MKNCRIYSIVLLFIALNCSMTTLASTDTEAFSRSYSYETAAEYGKAIAEIKSIYKADSYEHNLRLGWLHYLSGLFTESTAYYQKAIQIRKYAIEARFGYVLPAAALGNWDQVANQYVKILEVDPQNTLANYRLGLIYYGREEYGKAMPYFEKVVNLYPFDYDSLIMFAWSNLNLGKMREAKVLFNQVLLLSPKDQSALDGLKRIE